MVKECALGNAIVLGDLRRILGEEVPPSTLDPGPWTMDHGTWTLVPGPPTLDPGPSTPNPQPWNAIVLGDLRRILGEEVQGYLAHKKHPPPRTLQ